MGFYDEMQAVASEVLEEFKQGSISLIKLTKGAGPADNPGAGSETTYPLAAAMRGVKFKYVQQGLAVASDMQVTMAVIAVNPAMTDYILADGVRYKIVQIMQKPSAGTPVAFVLIVRKGS